MQVQQRQLRESGVGELRCFPGVSEHLLVLSQVPRVTAGQALTHKPMSTTDTSRLLHQAPGLPRVQLVVGRLQHLLYVTHQVCA